MDSTPMVLLKSLSNAVTLAEKISKLLCSVGRPYSVPLRHVHPSPVEYWVNLDLSYLWPLNMEESVTGQGGSLGIRDNKAGVNRMPYFIAVNLIHTNPSLATLGG